MHVPDETTFIQRTRRPAEAELAIAYARGFNLGNADEILDRLAPGATYGSQDTWEVLEGKEAVAQYVGGQIATTRKNPPDLLVRVELGVLPMGRRPVALLWQRRGGLAAKGLGVRKFAMQIVADEEGRALKLFSLTHSPPPASVPGTDLFPGLTPEQIAVDRRYRPLRISRDAPLEFLVFHLKGDARGAAMDRAVDEVADAYPDATVRRFTVDPVRAEPPPEVLEYNLKGFPSLVVRSGSTPLVVHTGLALPESLRRKLDHRLFDPAREGRSDRPA